MEFDKNLNCTTTLKECNREKLDSIVYVKESISKVKSDLKLNIADLKAQIVELNKIADEDIIDLKVDIEKLKIPMTEDEYNKTIKEHIIIIKEMQMRY